MVITGRLRTCPYIFSVKLLRQNNLAASISFGYLIDIHYLSSTKTTKIFVYFINYWGLIMSKFTTHVLILLFCLTQLSYAQENWEKIATFEGGMVNDLLASPSGAIYANSGVYLYKSDDLGDNWEPILKSVDTLFILEMGLSRDDQGVEAIVVLYAPSAFIRETKMIRSFDKGETWEELALPELDSFRVRSLISLRYGGLYCKASYGIRQTG